MNRIRGCRVTRHYGEVVSLGIRGQSPFSSPIALAITHPLTVETGPIDGFHPSYIFSLCSVGWVQPININKGGHGWPITDESMGEE